jgi:hypothetical protein
LDHIKAAFLANAKPGVGQIIARATEELRGSGITDRLPKAGSLLPEFELPDTEGRMVSSAELLKEGPLIISFYRGVW